jgi:ferritin-like metal-binding protein YciE
MSVCGKEPTMTISSLNELFIHQLKDVYDAEHQLVEALPKLAKAATTPELKVAFEQHLAETRKQVTRLQDVFADCGEYPGRETCDGMKGLIEEGEQMIKHADEPRVKDAALIAAAQKFEHYEIATYGSLIAWAETVGFTSARRLLEESLEEEKAADEKLTDLAESTVNPTAANELEEEEEASGPARTATRGRGATVDRSRTSTPARSHRAKK